MRLDEESARTTDQTRGSRSRSLAAGAAAAQRAGVRRWMRRRREPGSADHRFARCVHRHAGAAALSGRPAVHLRRQGEESAGRVAADRRRGPAGRRRSGGAAAADRRLDAAARSTSDKMKRFFELAFQQTQVTAVDFADQAYPKQIGINNTTTPLLVQNAQQSFARTMLQLIADGQPLTEGMTTHAADDDHRAQGAVRLPRRLGGRRRRQGHRSLQAGAPGLDDRRRDGAPGRSRSPTRSTRPAPTTCTGTTPTSPPTTRTSPAAPRIRSSTRRAASRCTTCSTARSTGTRAAPACSARRRAAAPRRRSWRCRDFTDWTHGDDPRAARRRGGDAVLRPAGAAHRDRAGADDPAHRLLQHAGVLRQLADQHQQPDARHPEPDADRGARRVGRRHRHHDDAGQPAARPRRRPRRRRRPAPSATRRSIRCARSSRPPTRGTTTTSSTRRSPRRRGCSRSAA